MLDAKGGEGPSMLGTEYVRFRGSVWDGLDSFDLSCVILCAFTFTFMHCILYMWWRDLCDRCAVYIVLYMSCHLVMLIGFASAFYSDSNELYYMYSYLIHIFWVHYVGLGHISMPNSFVLIVKSLYKLSMLKTSSLTHTGGCIVINHQKEGDWKHLGP